MRRVDELCIRRGIKTVSTLALDIHADNEILEAYRTGDRDRAATAFVRRHQRFVFSVASRHLASIDDAQDATQEVMVKALQSLDRFKGQSSLQTWLYRITINVCSNMRRKQKWMSYLAFGEGSGEVDIAADQPSTEQQTVDDEFSRYFERVLSALPQKQRETFCLRYYDELSYEEISAMLGTSVGALKANYHWAVKKIAEALRTSDYYKHWNQHQR